MLSAVRLSSVCLSVCLSVTLVHPTQAVELKSVFVFSKRQRIALRLLYAIAIPSVVCLSVVCLLSVTLVHPTQPVEIFGNFFHHTIAQGLHFSGAKNRWWGRTFPPKICVQSDPPFLKQRNFDKYRLIAPQS